MKCPNCRRVIPSGSWVYNITYTMERKRREMSVKTALNHPPRSRNFDKRLWMARSTSSGFSTRAAYSTRAVTSAPDRGLWGVDFGQVRDGAGHDPGGASHRACRSRDQGQLVDGVAVIRAPQEESQIKTARDDGGAARACWKGGQAALDPGKLMFVDETGAATDMARRYKRAPRGQRLVAAVPHPRRLLPRCACG